VQHDHLSSCEIGHKHITIGGDRQPKGLAESRGQNRHIESGRYLALEVCQQRDNASPAESTAVSDEPPGRAGGR
jgi:hypothetical protein